MSAQAIQAGEAFVKLSCNVDGFQKGLSEASDQLQKFGGKMKGTMEKFNGAFSGALKSMQPIAPAISSIGLGLSGIEMGIGTVSSLCDSFKRWYTEGGQLLSLIHEIYKAEGMNVAVTELCSLANLKNASGVTKLAAQNMILTFSELQKNIAMRIGNALAVKSAIATKAVTVASYACAVGTKLYSAVLIGFSSIITTATSAIWAMTTALLANPIVAITAAALAAIAVFAILGVHWLASESAASKAAKATEELRKQHDEFRESARQSADILDKLNKKMELNDEEKDVSQNAWNDLKRNADALGISLENLGISYDKETGKINATAEAMAKFREKMRSEELKELNKEIQAQGAYLDELTAKLHNGKVGWGRWLGTWATFGYMDNADEIQQKIDETRKKLRENTKRQSEVADFSEDFREAEKKLEDFQAKDEEATRNATQNKIAAIQKEFAERQAILTQLVKEANARKEISGLSDEENKKLEERTKVLKELNKKQQERINLLKEEEKANIRKIEEDYKKKRMDAEENKDWKKRMEEAPEKAAGVAAFKMQESERKFSDAVAERAAAVDDENATPEKIAALDEKVKKAQAEAEKWTARYEEAEAKAKDTESRRDKELDDLDGSRKQKEKARADKEEAQEWKDTTEKDSESARQTAAANLAENQGKLDAAYANLRNLIQTGASEKEKKAAKENVEQIEADIDKWQSRVDELQIGRLDKQQAASPVTNPAAMMAGSADAQRKFLENRNAQQNPMAETNSLLAQSVNEQQLMNKKLENLGNLEIV